MNVAIVGSSGGGGATLGHSDPIDLITCINRELSRIKIHTKEEIISSKVKVALFISVNQSLDSVTDDNKCSAKLYCVGYNDNDQEEEEDQISEKKKKL